MGDVSLTNNNTKLITLSNLEIYTNYIEEKNPQITYEEYQLLPSTKLSDNISYYIKDRKVVYKNGIVYGHDNGEANVQSDWNETDNTSDAYIANKPLAISVFINDSEFITKSVNDLTNYYNNTSTYSNTEVDNIISTTENGRFEVVSSLPTTNIKTDVIYLVPKSSAQTDDIKNEYINLDGTVNGWEKIGNTNIDLSGYYTSIQINTIINNAGTSLSNEFQSGVNSIYNAIVNKGSTPSSKSLGDVLTGISNIPNSNSGTYVTNTRSASIDMGINNTYRYVDTTDVPNSNSGTYAISSNGTYDMGATNDKRFIDISVPNSNSSTYTYPANDTGSIKDHGETNSYRYVNATNVYDKGLSDGKADHTATYTPTSRASDLDMGQTHSYRYVDTTSVTNSNSGTQSVTSNGIKDMGATNTQRYLDVSVANSNSGTYTFAENDTGGIKDMGAANDKRYVVATNVYNKGKADGKADHSTTYKPTSRASNNDMGQTHSYRYVNTTSVPNSNSGTYDITSNGTKDMGTTNNKRYVNVNVPNSNSGTYTFAANDTGGTKDLGATNTYRYANAANVYTKGKTDGKADHSTTYKPTTRASNCDMGQTHSYRYVNTTSVPNSNSGTYATVTTNGTHDMGASNTYRYVTVNVPHPTHTTTYTPTSRASKLDMGATNSYRYVDTTGVPNANSSGTYSVTSNGVKDMGATNSYRYVNINVSNSNTGTYNVTTNGVKDMGATNNKRYVNIQVPSQPYITISGQYASSSTVTYDVKSGQRYLVYTSTQDTSYSASTGYILTKSSTSITTDKSNSNQGVSGLAISAGVNGTLSFRLTKDLWISIMRII